MFNLFKFEKLFIDLDVPKTLYFFEKTKKKGDSSKQKGSLDPKKTRTYHFIPKNLLLEIKKICNLKRKMTGSKRKT